MTGRHTLLPLLAAMLFLGAGCGNAPGRPTQAEIPVDPDNVTDFTTLFASNCSGCHGAEGKGGPALSITDPVYLAIADDTILRKAVTGGIPGTSMPAFAKRAGGMLTDTQVDTIVRGIRARYGNPNVLGGISPPPYAAELGDATRGAAVYATYCVSCHGPGGTGGAKAHSIVDGAFLSLLTDQELRTLVLVGRPDFGAPDWRNNVPGKPMTSLEISDVVAWLAAQRPHVAGRPNPDAAKTAGELR